jgi:hypothetical protein
MAVYFRCKSCGDEHRSSAGFGDERSFATSPMPESEFKCQTTGRASRYGRNDMYWRADPAASSR